MNLHHCQTPLYKAGNTSVWISIAETKSKSGMGLPPVDTTHGWNLTAGEQMDSTATALKYMSSWLEWHI